LPIGFHVHDVYHVALLGETGWSEVAEILLLGKRDGYVSGPVALAEEAVIMDRFTQRPMTPSKAAVTLWNSTSDRLPVQGVQLARVFPRCDQARKGILAKLATQGTATATTRVPVTFARAAVRHAVGES